MQDVKGISIEPAQFGKFIPLQLLYEFDGPKTFTFLDANEELCLALWFDEDHTAVRYFVVPFSEQLVTKLTTGQLSVLEAIDQPRLWIVDIGHGWTPIKAVRTALSKFSDEDLPTPGTMLYASLEPFLSLRAIGETIRPGEIPGSVIRQTVEAAQKSIKLLAEYEMSLSGAQGRPSLALQRCYDLPAQSFKAASFEVSFRSPLSELGLFDQLSEEEKVAELTVLERVGQHLRDGLAWLSSTSDTNPAMPVPQNRELSLVILKAMKLLTPSPHTAIQTMEVRGDLVKTQSKPVRLTRNSRTYVNGILAKLPQTELMEPRTISGLVRQLNADYMQFTLRESEAPFKTWVCQFQPELWDEVHELLGENVDVKVYGRVLKLDTMNVLALTPILESMD